MEKTGNQSRHDGETYAEWMSRLYKPKAINYSAKVRHPDGHYETSGGIEQRAFWGFRVPHELALVAYRFMRENEIESITTYLTYTMHNLHNETTQNG